MKQKKIFAVMAVSTMLVTSLGAVVPVHAQENQMQMSAVTETNKWTNVVNTISRNNPVNINEAFKDENLRAIIKQNFDTDKNNQLSQTEIQNAKALDVSSKSQIQDMSGIEYLTNLTSLNCNATAISELDVSSNGDLEKLYCYQTNLSALNLSNNKKLKVLDCGRTNIQTLNVSDNTALEELKCWWTDITSLDVSENTNLKKLVTRGTQITSLNLKNNALLEHLECEECPNLTELILAENANLNFIQCSDTKVSTLDVSQMTELKYLYCYNTAITELNVKNCTKLNYFYCYGTSLAYLDLPSDANINLVLPSPTFTADATEGKILLDDLNTNIDETKVMVTSNGTLSGREIRVSDMKQPIVYQYNCGTTKDKTVYLTVTLRLVGDSTIVFKDSVSLNKPYDGSPVSLTSDDVAITGTSKTDVTFTWYQKGTDDTWAELTSAPQNAGKYKVTASVEGDSYCKGATSEPLLFEISKADSEWVTSLSITDWTYGEEANTPTAKAKFGDSEDIIYTYSKEKDGTYSENVPQTAGDWYVKATMPGTDNYAELTSEAVPFKIKKATPQYDEEGLKGLQIKQGEKLSTLSLPTGFAWKDGDQTADTLGQQQFKAVYTPEDTANYKKLEIDVEVKVVPALIPINNPPELQGLSDKTLTVGDTFNPLEGVTATDKEDGNLTDKIKVSGEVDTTKAGSYQVTYTVTDSQGATATKTITVTVNPKEETDNPQKPDGTTNTGGSGQNGNGTSPDKPDKDGAQTAVQTGDTTNIFAWSMTAVLSVFGIAVAGLKRRKSEKETD